MDAGAPIHSGIVEGTDNGRSTSYGAGRPVERQDKLGLRLSDDASSKPFHDAPGAVEERHGAFARLHRGDGRQLPVRYGRSDGVEQKVLDFGGDLVDRFGEPDQMVGRIELDEHRAVDVRGRVPGDFDRSQRVASGVQYQRRHSDVAEREPHVDASERPEVSTRGSRAG